MDRGRPVRTVPPMLASYVVRLVVDALEQGSIVGEVQAVHSGRRYVVRDEGELVAALLRGGADDDRPGVPVAGKGTDNHDE